MTEKLILKKAIGTALNAEGFTRKGNSWFLRGPDAVAVINLQKYEYDELYFINFGIGLRALGSDEFPAENHCHIRARLERLFPQRRDLIIEASTISHDNALVEEFKDFLCTEVSPFCSKCLTIEGLKTLLDSKKIPQLFVTAAARALLGLTDQV